MAQGTDKGKQASSQPSIPAGVHHRLLEQYAPPSVVVTEDHLVVHISETAARYLQVSPGVPTRELFSLLQPSLRVDVLAALQQASRAQTAVMAAGIAARVDARDIKVNITVRPAAGEGDPGGGLFLLLFEEDAAGGVAAAAAEPLVRHDGLRTAAALQSLLNSTDIATLVLDRQLRVRLATPRTRDIFDIVPAVGRSLLDIASSLVDDSLHANVSAVLDRLQQIEREVETASGRGYLMRVMPYRTADDHIDGVVITFVDITARLAQQQRIVRGEERLRLLIDSAVDYAIFTMTRDGIVDSWNSGAQRMFGYSAAEIVGRRGDLLFTPEDRAAGVPEAELERARLAGRADDERWHLRQDGTRLYCSGVTTRLGEDAGLGFAKIARDLTVQRQAGEALKQAHDELEARVEQRTRELQARVQRHAEAERAVLNLVRKLVTAQEDERARIARDLHDQLGQQLTALRLTLERHRDGAGGAAPDLQKALEIAAAIDSDVDFLAWELRPTALDDLGLLVALPRYLNEWSRHYDIAAEFRSSGMTNSPLSHEAEVAFYRVAQEALTNVVKHAHASRVDVILERRGDSVILVVEDNGDGFETGDRRLLEKGIGLLGMRERAALIGAALDIESTAGKGTTVFLRAPVPARGEAA